MAKKTNTGLQMYLRQIKEIPLLTAEQEKHLAELAQAGNKAAQDRLVAANLRLVVMAVKHYSQNTSLSFEDLVQEGNIGLMRATQDFKPELGWKFATYAMYWIKQSISRAILNHSKTIRIPVHIWELQNKYKKAQAVLMEKYGRAATAQEISVYLNVEEKKILEIETLIKDPVSLNTSLNDEDDGTLEDLVADTSIKSPDDKLDNEFLAKALLDTLLTLEEKEQEILIARFGLKGTRAKTLEEIGLEYGVSKERIRQIEQKALKKLRHPLRANSLKPYLN